MSDPIDELLAEVESKPKPALEPEKPKVDPEQAKKDEEVARKEEQLANLNRAIAEANDQLRTARKAKKQDPEEEELPVIDEKDPSVRAWSKRINETVDPMRSELEKEKEEIQTFALQEFLGDKPALAKNPEKVKELISTFQKIRTSTGRTKEGILLDLKKAYAAVFHDQLITAARQSRIEKAEQDILLSDIAVSRGATSYSTPAPKKVPLSADDQKIIDRWEEQGAPKLS